MAQTPSPHGRSDRDAAGPIVIVGIGAVLPDAADPEEMWRLLNGSRPVFSRPERFDMADFHDPDPRAADRAYVPVSGFLKDFRPGPELTRDLEDNALPLPEPSALWLREALYQALRGVHLADRDRVFAGFGYTADGSDEGERQHVLHGYAHRLAQADGTREEEWRARLASGYPQTGARLEALLPHRIGRAAVDGVLPARTEVVMVDTACSSSLYALDLAMRNLLEEDCDAAVCGGAFALVPRVHVLFSKIQGLSQSGAVRAFDRSADGVLFSDGAAALILKTRDRAQRDGDRILAAVKAVGLSCDGRGQAIYAPSSDGQRRAVRRSHRAAGIAAGDIGWIIAHATGTPAGDGAELSALAGTAAHADGAMVTGNKSILGHTGWAAGAVSLIQAVTGLQRNLTPPQPFVRDPIPELTASGLTIPTVATPLPTRNVGVSAFGFGGTNAHVVLTGPEQVAGEPLRTTAAGAGQDPTVLVGWSAELPERTDTAAVAAWLTGNGPAPDTTYRSGYPRPTFAQVPLPPPALLGTDRAQLMVAVAVGNLDPAVLGACRLLQETTGVVVGHTGPTRHALDYALRCHRAAVARMLSDGDGLPPEWPAVEKQILDAVPPGDDATLPGLMPNIIAARVCAIRDYRGLNMTVDTGPDSGLAALRTADLLLRRHTLDIVLVACVNGNALQELRLATRPWTHERPLAEGAFVLAVSRASVASDHGLPVLAHLRTDIGEGQAPAAAHDTSDPAHPLSDRTYLGADPLVTLLAAVERQEQGTLTGNDPWTSRIHYQPAPVTVP
ncbi:beta-ketoacyl synthase N-terminal-like domain-containing protein [Streptomyces sp. NPDC090442]|uniref:beta-ketoacyl [acyl carrier protein] synthase domain-containing protein n=1 Tax=Streptomyces sp. NPDC090442 TaxID=3365962 RepID=UPI003812ED7B